MLNAPIDDEEKPLDPAMVRVQAKLRRLLLIAGLTLGLGILAVFGAVIYRTIATVPVQSATAVANAHLSLADLGLPADAKLQSASSDGARIVLTYAHASGNTLVFLDERRLTVVGRLDLPAAP